MSTDLNAQQNTDPNPADGATDPNAVAQPGAPTPPGEPQESAEDRARRQGWKPRDEYNGNPENFRSAEQFLAVSENELPVMRERMRNMEGTVKNLQTTIEFQKRQNRVALDEQRDQIEAEFRAKMNEAVQAGDEDAAAQAFTDRDNAMKRHDEKVEASTPPEEEKAPQAIIDFVERNKWYGPDGNFEMTEFAKYRNGVLTNANPGMSHEARMAQLEAEVKQQFPHYFAHQGAPNDPGVASGRRFTAQQGAQTFDNMPDEWRAGFEESVKAGLIENTDEGRQHYADVYFKTEAEKNG